MSDEVTRSTLARQGVQGVVFPAGGPFGIVAGALAAGIFSGHLAWLLQIMKAAGIVLVGLGGYWIWKLIANLRKRM